jgi:GGDEF domain-containing protein
VSLFPADGGDGEALLRNADAAMYRAKELGRNQVRFFGR